MYSNLAFKYRAREAWQVLSYITLGLVVVAIIIRTMELRALRRKYRKIEEQYKGMLDYVICQYGDEEVKAQNRACPQAERHEWSA